MANGPLPPVIEYTYQRVETNYPFEAPLSDAQRRNLPSDDAHTVTVDRDEAEQLLVEIDDAVQEREHNWTVTELVLGVEVFVPVDVYCRRAYDQTFESWIGLNVTVIPGATIAPVIPTHIRREEFLRERT